jgi:hypothetical protein
MNLLKDLPSSGLFSSVKRRDPQACVASFQVPELVYSFFLNFIHFRRIRVIWFFQNFASEFQMIKPSQFRTTAHMFLSEVCVKSNKNVQLQHLTAENGTGFFQVIGGGFRIEISSPSKNRSRSRPEMGEPLEIRPSPVPAPSSSGARRPVARPAARPAIPSLFERLSALSLPGLSGPAPPENVAAAAAAAAAAAPPAEGETATAPLSAGAEQQPSPFQTPTRPASTPVRPMRGLPSPAPVLRTLSDTVPSGAETPPPASLFGSGPLLRRVGLLSMPGIASVMAAAATPLSARRGPALTIRTPPPTPRRSLLESPLTSPVGPTARPRLQQSQLSFGPDQAAAAAPASAFSPLRTRQRAPDPATESPAKRAALQLTSDDRDARGVEAACTPPPAERDDGSEAGEDDVAAELGRSASAAEAAADTPTTPRPASVLACAFGVFCERVCARVLSVRCAARLSEPALLSMRVPALRTMLKQWNQPTTGTKARGVGATTGSVWLMLSRLGCARASDSAACAAARPGNQTRSRAVTLCV